MIKNKKPYFPIFVDLTEKQVIVVGAGTIAKRRIRTLVDFTNHLTVIAPEVNRELMDMEKAGLLTIKRKNYEREDIYHADYVIAATNDHQINSDIYSVCPDERIVPALSELSEIGFLTIKECDGIFHLNLW